MVEVKRLSWPGIKLLTVETLKGKIKFIQPIQYVNQHSTFSFTTLGNNIDIQHK